MIVPGARRHTRGMRLRSIALPLPLVLLAACEPDPPTEIWDLRATPAVCDYGVDYGLCRGYTLVESGEYHGLYQGVDGLDEQWGHEYRVEVAIYEVENPPADGFDTRYELVEILSDTPKPALEFDVALTMASVDVEQGSGELAPQFPFTCEQALCEALATTLEQGIDERATFRFGSEGALLPAVLVSVP